MPDILMEAVKMLKIIMLLFTIFLCRAIDVSAQQAEHIHKPHPHRHKEYAKKKNPIPMSEESISKGRDLYNKHCIACHGESAKGGIASDLTDELWIHGNSDGEIFHVISDGVKSTTMRGFKKVLTKEMRWHIVNYIKSLKIEGK